MEKVTATQTVTTTISTDDARRLVGMVATRDDKGRYVVNGAAYWMLDEALHYALVEISAANGIEL